MPIKTLDEITYPFPNTRCNLSVNVCKQKSPCWRQSQFILVKGAPERWGKVENKHQNCISVRIWRARHDITYNIVFLTRYYGPIDDS